MKCINWLRRTELGTFLVEIYNFMSKSTVILVCIPLTSHKNDIFFFIQILEHDNFTNIRHSKTRWCSSIHVRCNEQHRIRDCLRFLSNKYQRNQWIVSPLATSSWLTPLMINNFFIFLPLAALVMVFQRYRKWLIQLQHTWTKTTKRINLNNLLKKLEHSVWSQLSRASS